MYEKLILKTRLYRSKHNEAKVVVIKEVTDNKVTFLHAPPITSDICWFVPPQRETLFVSEFQDSYKPFK